VSCLIITARNNSGKHITCRPNRKTWITLGAIFGGIILLLSGAYAFHLISTSRKKSKMKQLPSPKNQPITNPYKPLNGLDADSFTVSPPYSGKPFPYEVDPQKTPPSYSPYANPYQSQLPYSQPYAYDPPVGLPPAAFPDSGRVSQPRPLHSSA